ncbi:MAG TPA: hypothetical protein PKD51_20820, partial [Saprospiraceae bacterium]|nr:hypothetical protein [Saprospiraceae bacterium]
GNDGGGIVNGNTDDVITGNGTGTPGSDNTLTDEDDHDPAQVQIQVYADVALIKVLGSGQANPVQPGATVNYQIQVLNQGIIPLNNIEITDYTPSCFTLSDANWTTVGSGFAVRTLSVANGFLTQPLAPGASVFVPISFTVGACSGIVTNWAEVSQFTGPNGENLEDIDSTPDDELNNDTYITNNSVSGNGKLGGDEDDHDPEQILVTTFEDVFDLALTKKLAPGQSAQVAAGDVVVFRIEVFNQGTFSADNIQVVDYIPTCFTLFDSDWVSTNGNRAIKTLSVANGGLSAPLASGQSVTVDINLKVLSCTAGDYFNWSEIGAATDDGGNIWPDVDSTPDNVRTNDVYTQDNFIDGNGKQGGDEDDHDPALVTVVAVPPGDFDLALIKQLAPGQPSSVQNGDLITFLISVVNQGDISADNINVVDYYPPCFVLTDPSWINNGNNTASHLLTVENTRLDAPLLPGSVVQVPISFTLNNCPIGTSTNYSEVQSATDSNGDPVTDVDSSPDNNNTNDPYGDDDQLDGNGTDDEDDHDPETIQIVEDRDEVFDLALIKTLAPGQQNTVMAGDPAKFQIQITNQGNVPADNIVITDYIPNCFELNDSDWTDIGGGRASLTLSVANGGLLLPLASGQSVFVEI